MSKKMDLDYKKVQAEEFLLTNDGRRLDGIIRETEKNEHKKECSRYNCIQCDFDTLEKSDLDHHMRTHLTQCNEGQAEQTNSNEKSHQVASDRPNKEDESPQTPKKCIETSSSLKRTKLFHRYLRKYSGKKRYQCVNCFRRYTRYCNLKTHMKIHKKDHTFNCRRCFIGFLCETQKDEHERECRLKRYNCDQCDFFTLIKQNMDHHMRVHLNEKQYQCDRCHVGFARSIIYQDHKRVHVKEFPFTCSRCFDGFILQTEKDAHENECTFHRYHCDRCDFVTLVKHTMNRHMRVHGAQSPSGSRSPVDDPLLNVDVEKNSLTSKSNKRIETNDGCSQKCAKKGRKCECSKMYQCNHCDRSFLNLISIRDHKKVHAKEFPYNCSRCFEGFLQLKRKDDHEKCCKVKRYSCQQCAYETLIISNFQRHKQRHLEEKIIEGATSSDATILKSAKRAQSLDQIGVRSSELIKKSKITYQSTVTDTKSFEHQLDTMPTIKINITIPTGSSGLVHSLNIPMYSNELATIDRAVYKQFNICFNDSL